MDSVSESDWVTGDSGSLSDHGEGVLLDDGALLDEGDDLLLVVLDVGELSLEDSVVSSDELLDLLSVVWGSGLEGGGVLDDLLLDDLDDLLSVVDNDGGLLLDSLVVTGLGDWVLLVDEDLLDLALLGSIDSVASLDNLDGSLLILLDEGDLLANNSSVSSDVLSSSERPGLLVLNDVLGSSSDDSDSLLSEVSEGSPALSSRAGDSLLVVLLGNLESLELLDDLENLVSLLDVPSDHSVEGIDLLVDLLVLLLISLSAPVSSALSHLLDVVVVLLLKLGDLGSVLLDSLVGELDELLLGDNHMSVVLLGHALDDDHLVLDDLSLVLVHDEVLGTVLGLEDGDLLENGSSLGLVGLDGLEGDSELVDLLSVLSDLGDVLISLDSELVVLDLDLGERGSLPGSLVDDDERSLLDLGLLLGDLDLLGGDSLVLEGLDLNDLLLLSGDLLLDLGNLLSVLGGLELLLENDNLGLLLGDLLVSDLDSLGVLLGLDSGDEGLVLESLGNLDLGLDSLDVGLADVLVSLGDLLVLGLEGADDHLLGLLDLLGLLGDDLLVALLGPLLGHGLVRLVLLVADGYSHVELLWTGDGLELGLLGGDLSLEGDDLSVALGDGLGWSRVLLDHLLDQDLALLLSEGRLDGLLNGSDVLLGLLDGLLGLSDDNLLEGDLSLALLLGNDNLDGLSVNSLGDSDRSVLHGLEEGLVLGDLLLVLEDGLLLLGDSVELALELTLGLDGDSALGPVLHTVLGDEGDLLVALSLGIGLLLDHSDSLGDNVWLVGLDVLDLGLDDLVALLGGLLLLLDELDGGLLDFLGVSDLLVDNLLSLLGLLLDSLWGWLVADSGASGLNLDLGLLSLGGALSLSGWSLNSLDLVGSLLLIDLLINLGEVGLDSVDLGLVGVSDDSELLLDLLLAFLDDLLGLGVLDELLLGEDGVSVLLDLGLLVSLLGWDLGDLVGGWGRESLTVLLEPGLSDLDELLGTWDEDLLVLEAAGILAIVLSLLEALELVVVLPVEDIELVAESVTVGVELVGLAVESDSVVGDLSADISNLGLASVLWEEDLALDTDELSVVGVVGEALLDTEEGLVSEALALGIELGASGDLVLVVSGGTLVSSDIFGVLVLLLGAVLSVPDNALLGSVDGGPLGAGLVLVSLGTESLVRSHGVGGTLALDEVLELLLLVLLLELLELLGGLSDDLLALVDVNGELVDLDLGLLDLGDGLVLLLLEDLLEHWGSLSLDLLLDLVGLLDELLDLHELLLLLVDLLLADLNGVVSDEGLGLLRVLLHSLLDLGLDLLKLEGLLLGLELELLDEHLDLGLLGLDLVDLDLGLEGLGLEDLLGGFTLLEVLVLFLNEFLEGDDLLFELGSLLLLLLALGLHHRDLLGEGLYGLGVGLDLLLHGDFGLHIDELVVHHLRIDFLDDWVHEHDGWLDGAGNESDLGHVGLLLKANHVLIDFDDCLSVDSYSC